MIKERLNVKDINSIMTKTAAFQKKPSVSPSSIAAPQGKGENYGKVHRRIESFASDSHEATAKDFITLLKPGVLLLVVYTAAIGLFLSPVNLHPFLNIIVIFAIAMGSGGAAAFNMWYDRDIDGVMSRTKNRPIPKGLISPNDALSFAILLSTTSVLVLFMATNALAAALLAFSIFFYAFIYTVLLKRHTSQNIVIGGAAGAFPPVIGWIAATGNMNAFEPWLLFSIIFLWTPSHFWALALYRSKDYELAQVPMLPVTAGIKHTKYQILIYAVFLVVSSFSLLLVKDLSFFYLTTASILGAIYLYLAGRLFMSEKPANSMKLFGYSIFYLFALFTFLILDVLFV